MQSVTIDGWVDTKIDIKWLDITDGVCNPGRIYSVPGVEALVQL